MGYNRVILYGQQVDVYRYDRDISTRVIVRERVTLVNGVPCFSEDGKNVKRKEKREVIRSSQSAGRASVSFRRLVGANLSKSSHPLFISLTYRENMEDVGQARKDFKSFARRITNMYGKQVKYVSVFEFQERGAVHFHVLFWGLPESIVVTERATRMVAGIWGKGYIDIVATDGNPKLASYLSKYMAKTFADKRLSGRKCYIASRNILRPTDDRDASISMYFSGICVPDLNKALLTVDMEYDTQWLGRANYKQYQIL